MYGLTAVKGIGRRFSNLLLKRAGVDTRKRAGELTKKETELVLRVLENPAAFGIEDWFLNRRKDFDTNKSMQVYSNTLSTALRNDLERMKKMRLHRGVRHFWKLKVRGQHTCTTGRG